MAADPADPRFAEVELGIAAQRFVETPLASKMILDCEIERRELCEALVRLDVETVDGRTEFRAKQRRIDKLDCWQEVIAAYIQRGQAAEDALAAEDAPAGEDHFSEGEPDG